MNNIIERLRDNFDHETARVKKHADLQATMDRRRGKKDQDRLGWIIGAAALFAIVVVGGIALSNRGPLDSRPNTDVAVAPPTTASPLLAGTTPEWVEEGTTDFVVDQWAHQSLSEADGVLYGISTKPAPDTPSGVADYLSRSDDGGLTWAELPNPADSFAGLTVAESALYAVSTAADPVGAATHISGDGGETWDSTSLPVGSTVDSLHVGGVVPAPNGGVITATEEVTNVAARAVPDEFQSDEFEIFVMDDEELEALVEEMKASGPADESPLPEEPSEESGPDGVATTVPEGATVPPGDRVVVMDMNGQVVFEETLDVLGIDEPYHQVVRVFHIDPDGVVTELENDLLTADLGWSEPGMDQLFDLGESMLLTGWTRNGLTGALSTDGTNWKPIDLTGLGEVLATGSVDGTAVIIGQNFQQDQVGVGAMVSDDPMGGWSELDLTEYLPGGEIWPVGGEVGDAGIVLSFVLYEDDAPDLEDAVVGGTILSTPDLQTWSVQDLDDLGDGNIKGFGPTYSVGDTIYLTGYESEGSRVTERHIFSTQLD